MSKRAGRPTSVDTDTRLQAERAKTDQAIATRATAVEHDADQAVTEARHRAGQVIADARARADQELPERSAPARRALSQEREREDDALRRQHEQADEVAARERQERKRMLTDLLGAERAATDKSLLLERVDAQEAISKRDHFLGMVSHDLRNELGGIGVSAARLITTAGNDDAGQKVFRTATNIQRITLRMSRLIGDLLDVASIEADKFTIVAEEHDINRLMDELFESFQAIAAAKDIHLEARTIGGSLIGRFDQQRILQVLTNLLTNALKFSSPGGRVTICAERKDGDAWLSVKDAGPGIAADRLDSIFDRFSRGSRSEGSGLGLGLYIARRIVEAHHGRLWVESTLGSGSTFHFTLPLAP